MTKILIDEEDMWVVDKYSISIAAGGYAICYDSEAKSYTYLHRLLMNPPNGMFVDHINGDKLDNRRCNLRFATPSQNNYNAKQPNTKLDGLPKGVYEHKKRMGKKFQVKFKWDGCTISYGYYATIAEAEAAYLRGVEFYRGTFALHLSRKETKE